MPSVTFAYVFDAGPFRVRKYESVVIGSGTRVEVVSEEQKAGLLDSRPCCWLMVNSRCARLGCMRVPLMEGKQQYQTLSEEYDIPCQSYGEVGDQPARRVTQCTSQIRCSHSYKNSTPFGQTVGGDRAPRIY